MGTDVRTDRQTTLVDPLGQTHSHGSREHCFVFLDLKSGDVRTEGRMDGQHVQKQ